MLIGLIPCLAHAQEPVFVFEAGAAERIFSFTNKQAAFYCGMANGENANGFHGITQAKQKLFEQYWIAIDGVILERKAARTVLTPWSLTRTYAASGVTEEVFFADSLTLLGVRVKTRKPAEVTFIPAWSASFATGTNALHGRRYTIGADVRTSAWSPDAQGEWEPADEGRIARLKNPGPMHAPGWFRGKTLANTATFFVEFTLPPISAPERSAKDFDALRSAKEQRIRAVIDEAGFACSDTATTFAAAWIRASMDALVMKQSGIGIYAGLPWFDDYWGRDTFISLPGALLVSGRFEEAKEVIKSFADFQCTDENDPNFGRIPNRVQPKDMIYNTADGTPLLVRAAWRYIQASGDTAFARELLPFLDRSIRGTLKYHTDSLGFLTHGDAETWMDAVGPDGPWSPRGNRAVEVEALWYTQLVHSSFILRSVDPRLSWEWLGKAHRVAAELYRHFFLPDLTTVDHVTGDGLKDERPRPNILLAASLSHNWNLNLGFPTFDIDKRWPRTIYSYGVASLGPDDPNFHPFHELPERYPKDAAYHNGIIWTWLTGAAVDALRMIGAPDSAWLMTKALERLAMEQGAAGTLPECTDALPRPGTDAVRWSGTFSQAWSNAEYLRTFFDDYLGLRIRQSLSYSTLSFSPMFPVSVSWMRHRVRVRDNWIDVHVQRAEGGTYRVRLHHERGVDTLDIHPPNLDPSNFYIPFLLHPGETRDFKATPVVTNAKMPTQLFLIPHLDPTLASIRAPQHRMLDGATVTKKEGARQVILSADDKAGDDTGPNGGYVYPKSPLFRKGILDIRHFKVERDGENAYFTVTMGALSQPGWHPEYGFQLTMLAIGIDQTGDAAQQARGFRHNSRYTLPKKRGFDKLILVGGGVQVRDKDDGILAEFVPHSESDAIGDVRTSTISFAIPLSILGPNIGTWSYNIIAGAQDDHGGAGIGEFREVQAQPSEWNGGGNTAGGANVYDTMFAAPR